MKTSIIIPAFHEETEVAPGVTVLQRTVRDILEKATGDFEIIVGFDGNGAQELPNDPRVKTYSVSPRQGIKHMVNHLAKIATGDFLFKTDGHCMFAKGFDEVLQADMKPDWLVMPRFYVLDEKTWAWQDERFYDYFYLSCPFTDPKGFRFKAGGHWPERTKERLDIKIDETPQIHGSGWFCTREHFLDTIGGFDFIEEDPLGHAQEPPWLGLNTWLKGGKVMVNKNTWYAHMHKSREHDRGYQYTNEENEHSYRLIANYFMNKPEVMPLIEKFMPMPTWPENWKELYEQHLKTHN